MKKNVYDNLTQLVGNTPMLKLNKVMENNKSHANIIAKLEYFNPLGSVKDRVAHAMIKDAEEKGLINKDTTIIEPTSGNTGIGLSFVTAVKDYKLILVMPDSMSIERRKIMKALGAEIVLTEGAKGMKGAIDKANALAEEIDNSFIPEQFSNESNPLFHEKYTGPEIWNDLDGDIDVLVAGVGTGGTISGVSKFIKSKNKNLHTVAVEPTGSAVISGEKAGPHKIQGIGAGFIPNNLNTEIIDEIIKIDNDIAFEMSRQVAKTEGLLVGISSGAALYAAIQLSKKEEYKDKNIVVILPDTGERYLSTTLFD